MSPGQRTALHSAARDDDAAKVQALLTGGESPDVQDEQGFTPLHIAAQEYSLSAATALLANGAQVDVKNSFGNTPLSVAVFNSNGRGEIIHLLRASGADPKRENSSGQTPAGLARLIANYDVAQFFLDVPD